jgi:short-subunit dehydrogenase
MKHVALITGASSGIGKELAMLHAEKTGDVVLVARNSDALSELKIVIERTYHRNVEIIVMDLMVPDAAAQVYTQLNAKNIQISYLINNAGLGGYGNFYERDWVKDQAMIQLNIIALTQLTHLILPDMIQRKQGKILNTASTAGFIPGPLQAVYFATKAFVVSFSQALDQEVRVHGITVTALCPGPVQTGFAKNASMDESPLFNNAASSVSTARKGYRAMMRGKLICITDFSLRIALNSLLPFVPRRLVLKMVEKMQRIN